MHIQVIQYADPDCPGTRMEIRTDIQRGLGSFKNFLYFFRLAEIITFKLELFKKFTCFTETPLFFHPSPTIASGTEYTCAPRIRWAGFANAGFQVVV